MNLSVTLTYPANPQRVAEMFADPQYTLRSRFADLPDEVLAAFEVSSSADGDGFAVSISGQAPASTLPEAFSKFVPGAVKLDAVDAWGAPQSDGSRTGTIEISLHGLPVSITANQNIAPGTQPATTVRTVDANISVNIPLMGAMIERKAAEHVEQVLGYEEAAGASWLAEH